MENINSMDGYFLLNANYDAGDFRNVLDLKIEELQYLRFLRTKKNRKKHWERQKNM